MRVLPPLTPSCRPEPPLRVHAAMGGGGWQTEALSPVPALPVTGCGRVVYPAEPGRLQLRTGVTGHVGRGQGSAVVLTQGWGLRAE